MRKECRKRIKEGHHCSRTIRKGSCRTVRIWYNPSLEILSAVRKKKGNEEKDEEDQQDDNLPLLEPMDVGRPFITKELNVQNTAGFLFAEFLHTDV